MAFQMNENVTLTMKMDTMQENLSAESASVFDLLVPYRGI
jgi:hypothetical protein